MQKKIMTMIQYHIVIFVLSTCIYFFNLNNNNNNKMFVFAEVIHNNNNIVNNNNNNVPLQSANIIMSKLKQKTFNRLRANNNRNSNRLPQVHRFKSYPLPDPNDPDEVEGLRPPVRGRKEAYEDNTTHTQWNTMGFLSDYYCTAKIFDEPRRMRLSCTKNPKRIMNCFCEDKKENEVKIPCRCEPAVSSKSKHINLVNKFVGT